MAAAIVSMVMIGSAAAVSDIGGTGPQARDGQLSRQLTLQPRAASVRSETVVAYGPNKVGAEKSVPRTASNSAALAAPASLSTAQQEGANNAYLGQQGAHRARQSVGQRQGDSGDAPDARTRLGSADHLRRGEGARTRVGRYRPNRCPDHHAGLRYYRQQHRRWLRARGAHFVGRKSLRSPRSCADARYLAVVWRGRAARARTATEQWIARYTLRDFQVYPGSNAWRAAVQEVQRVYPGSSGWLLSCSASEGGHGRFVFNSQGSGAAGWLQYMPGTFAGFSWRARVDAARRGFIVPASASSLYSPLGQALAGGWALRNGLTHHWAGHGC